MATAPHRTIPTLMLTAALAWAACAANAGAATTIKSQIATNASRAQASYLAMQNAFYSQATGLYTGADAWPYSQAMAATISLAGIPGLHAQYRADLIARLSGLQSYADTIDPAPAGYVSELSAPAGATRYNDDNEWIGIELLRLYHLDHSPPLLTTAADIMNLVTSQWVTKTGVACAGGVPWASGESVPVRNTITNSAGAELGAQLYMTTHVASYLTWAVQLYNWTRTCLLNSDGLYSDTIGSNGALTTTEWTYNQGTMIGAGVMLYQATGNSGYLAQAEATAIAALAKFGPAQLADQPVYFNAIYIRNLLLLGGVSGDPRYETFAQWFAQDAWSNVRDFQTGLFHSGPGGSTGLLDQAAMVQVYALLAEPPSAYF